jgi:hypothetical protein
LLALEDLDVNRSGVAVRPVFRPTQRKVPIRPLATT